jgi:O-antigen/teichoic acid export membrane protein
MPLVLAELINPLYFFNGTEQLLPFNIGNLISKLGSVVLIVLFVRSAQAAPWVNFFLGFSTLVMFALLNAYLFKTNSLAWKGWDVQLLPRLIKKNLPLAGNNLSVQLQQSFFLFVLSGTGNAALLGAYAIADKVLWGFRLILISLSNALFPKAVLLASVDPVLARQRKKQINLVLIIMFSVVAFVLYFQADWMVQLFAGEESPIATNLMRAISCVPLLMALNLLNVMEMLVQQRYRDIFQIALLLTTFTVVVSLAIGSRGENDAIAWYPFIMELATLVLYTIFLARKTSPKSVA